MSPPGGITATPINRRWMSAEATSQTEQAIRAAHAILDNIGLEMSASKISRLVRRFAFRVERNGWSFFEFFTNAIRLTADQRRRALADPDVARTIAYLDITGETAAWNVDRERQRAGDTDKEGPPGESEGRPPEGEPTTTGSQYRPASQAGQAQHIAGGRLP